MFVQSLIPLSVVMCFVRRSPPSLPVPSPSSCRVPLMDILLKSVGLAVAVHQHGPFLSAVHHECTQAGDNHEEREEDEIVVDQTADVAMVVVIVVVAAVCACWQSGGDVGCCSCRVATVDAGHDVGAIIGRLGGGEGGRGEADAEQKAKDNVHDARPTSG